MNRNVIAMMRIARPLALAFVFLTRLPLRVSDARPDEVGRSIAFFPVVGLTLGALLITAAWPFSASTLPALIGLALVAMLAGLTGGLHLDGLADVFDGLGGAHGSRERMLAIMRDSRIGAHGAVALMLVVLAKSLALGVAVQRHDAVTVVAFPAVARWAVVPLLVFFPYVRAEGLGEVFHARGSGREVALATAFVVALGLWSGTTFIVPTVAALAVALAFAAWMQRRLGGLTGDVYGAAIELTEVAFLVAASNR